jgi:hypothetical protein
MDQYQHTTINMDGDDEVSVDDVIHKGKGQCENVPLRQWTCDCGARVFVDLSERQGTYNDGIGIGVGIVKAKGIYYYNLGVSVGKKVKKVCIQCDGRTLVAMARR